jgi:hypothetical protein
LKYTFLDSDSEESLPITPTRDPRRNSKCSTIGQVGTYDDGNLEHAKSDFKAYMPTITTKDMVSESRTNQNSGTVAEYQYYLADIKTRRSIDSTYGKVYLESIPRALRSHSHTTDAIASVPTTPLLPETQSARSEDTVEFEVTSVSQEDIQRIFSFYQSNSSLPISDPFTGANATTPTLGDTAGPDSHRWASIPIQQQSDRPNTSMGFATNSPQPRKRSGSLLKRAGTVSFHSPC